MSDQISAALPRRFRLIRDLDFSGVSGVGHVADGVQWPCGQVALMWLGEHGSLAVWDSLGSMLAVHGHGGSTGVEWVDPERR